MVSYGGNIDHLTTDLRSPGTNGKTISRRALAKYAHFAREEDDDMRPRHVENYPDPTGKPPKRSNVPYLHPDDSDNDPTLLYSPQKSPANSDDEADLNPRTRGKITFATDFDSNLIFPPHASKGAKAYFLAMEFVSNQVKERAAAAALAETEAGDKVWTGFHTGYGMRDLEAAKVIERRELTVEERKEKEEKRKGRSCKSPEPREKRKYEWKGELKNKRHCGGPRVLADVRREAIEGGEGGEGEGERGSEGEGNMQASEESAGGGRGDESSSSGDEESDGDDERFERRERFSR